MKMKILALILLSAALSIADEAPKKSSAIPDRREFPVNDKINPCENFYDYACSKVIDSFQLREDRSAHTFSFHDSNERILEFKMKYFKDLATAKPSSERESMIKNYYLACMNESARAKEEKEFVKNVLAEVEPIKTREALLKFFQKKVLSPETGFVGFGSMPNQDKPTMNDVYFETPMITMPEKTYYDKDDLMKDYKDVAETFFKAIGSKDAEKDAALVTSFEKEISKNYPTPQDFRVLMASRTGISRKDLTEKFPALQFGETLKSIPNHTEIRNLMPKTFEDINKKLNEMSVEDLKTIYVFYELVELLDDAYPEVFNKRFAFSNKHLGGPATRAVRQERCTKDVMAHFTKEIDSILWPRLFKNFPEKKFVALAERIRGSILESLHENKWLSKQAKAEAIKKIMTAKLQLVAPKTDEEWNFNPKTTYSTETPIANRKKLNALMIAKQLKELKAPVSKLRWGMGPLTINAYYHPPYNKFVLPVGILQYPFYDAKSSDEANLAAIGSVIGHELGHGIDDKGSKYDSSGVLHDWMTKDDLDHFKSRTAILVEQFNKIGHNGELTLGENIGDLVGLTASYRAAFHDVKKPSLEKKKEFFLQFARAWCEVQRPKYSEMRLKSDPHSLGFARTNEQVKQQTGFKEAYGCKDGDPMTLPSDKIVHLW